MIHNLISNLIAFPIILLVLAIPAGALFFWMVLEIATFNKKPRK